MKLGTVIENLEKLDDRLCIVAKRPWGASSEAMLVELTADFRLPEPAVAAGFDYFLEVSIALEEVLGDLIDKLSPESRV